jgi:periplasmic copper chaperone A
MKAKTRWGALSSSRAGGPARAGLSVALATALMAATGSAALAAGVRLEKPWMRLIIKARPAAGYFTLHNETTKTVTLTGASSSACGMMMLHESKVENGVEKMMHVAGLKVPAGGTLTFRPGHYHLMCMQPKDSMAVGKRVPVTLKFADGQTLTAQFPVTGPGGMKK